MVVRFHLGENVRQLVAIAVRAVRIGIELFNLRPLEDRGIVRIHNDVPLRVRSVRFADHAEQRFRPWLAVDDPFGVENLVPAMLRICLREHHQLDIGRITLHPADEHIEQVVDFVLRQRQPKASVRLDQRRTAAGQRINMPHRSRRNVAEQRSRPGKVIQHGFNHAVMQQRRDAVALAGRHVRHVKGNAPFNAFHGFQSAIPGNIGGL